MSEWKMPDEGRLWSFCRRLIALGGDIHTDYCAGKYGSYEEYSARLDEAARERGDELSAMLSAAPQPTEREGWQPIETAPKGGGAEVVTDPKWVPPQKILLRFGSEAISVAYWDSFYAQGGNGCTDGFAWIEPCSGSPLNLHYTTAPDGWMPLPPPPTDSGREKG